MEAGEDRFKNDRRRALLGDGDVDGSQEGYGRWGGVYIGVVCLWSR